ncbi:MAG: T9SS type A sorting domain-containing protein [Crocinitomicaceae bacterium]|nr:T9SS type A sorting domain-containing protein [Crocinitomicaceae bacterium]
MEPLQFAVYPNPTKDFLTIDLINHSGEASKIRIYDTKGSLIEAIEFSGINMQLQTSSWEEGLYFLELENGNRKVTSKIVKQ